MQLKTVATAFTLRQNVSQASRMSQHEKLLERLRGNPKDFTWEELKRLLRAFGYMEETGKGSRRKFIHGGTKAMISLHEPHPGNILKSYQVQEILIHLKQEGYL